MIRTLDLFSGIGGFALAGQRLGCFDIKQFVEIDPYCQKVLAKNFPGIPIHDDVRTYTAKPGQFDLITFGSPCQDISKANKDGRGLEGGKSGLFWEAIRIIRLVQPRFCLFENVANVLNRNFDQILWTFFESGYDAEWQTISAASVGAPHLRERVFVIAYPTGQRSQRQERRKISQTRRWNQPPNSNWWDAEPRILRVAHGIPKRMDRIRGLGNAVVPQVAAIALQRIMEINQHIQ